jgi:hypothetical protein
MTKPGIRRTGDGDNTQNRLHFLPTTINEIPTNLNTHIWLYAVSSEVIQTAADRNTRIIVLHVLTKLKLCTISLSIVLKL